jgi:hypothetical protein
VIRYEVQAILCLEDWTLKKHWHLDPSRFRCCTVLQRRSEILRQPYMVAPMVLAGLNKQASILCSLTSEGTGVLSASRYPTILIGRTPQPAGERWIPPRDSISRHHQIIANVMAQSTSRAHRGGILSLSICVCEVCLASSKHRGIEIARFVHRLRPTDTSLSSAPHQHPHATNFC